MKVVLKKNEVLDALFRDLSKIPTSSPECFEMKITVTPKNNTPFNIALGFTKEELLRLRREIFNVVTGWSAR